MSNELIEKYLRGLCTPEESEAVASFLKANPDHPFLVKEWEDTDGITALPGNHTQLIFDTVEASTSRTSNSNRMLLWRIGMAAAVTGIVTGLFFLLAKNEPPPAVASTKQLPAAIWYSQRNNGRTDTFMLLPDGSRITLSPQASIRYRENFNGYEKREIYMTGYLFFEVAKNKAKPFIVYSRNLNTTALGTAFFVDAPEKTNHLRIAVVEGKIRVAITDSVNVPHKDYYLYPGDALAFNTLTGQGTLSSFTVRKKDSKRNDHQKKQFPGTAAAAYMFNNQTLAEVLDQLSVMYGVEIQYPKASIGNNYFIGKIDRNDALDKIINDIALLNKLSVKKQNGAFILKKKN